MSNVANLARHSEPKLLPVVRRVIEQLNLLFIDHFGVLGKGLVDDVFRQWLLAGKTGPSGLRHYVSALGMQLEDVSVREEFTERADRLLLHLQSGYVS